MIVNNEISACFSMFLFLCSAPKVQTTARSKNHTKRETEAFLNISRIKIRHKRSIRSDAISFFFPPVSFFSPLSTQDPHSAFVTKYPQLLKKTIWQTSQYWSFSDPKGWYYYLWWIFAFSKVTWRGKHLTQWAEILMAIFQAREVSFLQEIFPWCSVEKGCCLWEKQLRDFQTQHHRERYGTMGVELRDDMLITDR